MFASAEGASACEDCEKPACAKQVKSCDPLTGLEQQYTYYNESEVCKHRTCVRTRAHARLASSRSLRD